MAMARLKGEKANVTRAGRARENRYESVEQEKKEQVETAERTDHIGLSGLILF